MAEIKELETVPFVANSAKSLEQIKTELKLEKEKYVDIRTRMKDLKSEYKELRSAKAVSKVNMTVLRIAKKEAKTKAKEAGANERG